MIYSREQVKTAINNLAGMYRISITDSMVGKAEAERINNTIDVAIDSMETLLKLTATIEDDGK